MLRRYWLEIAWAVFGALNVVAIFAITGWETVPFHFIWVSLTLLYGFRVWRRATTALVLGAVIATTGAALVWVVVRGDKGLEEVTEVPLMAAMFLVMAWHAERRQRAVEEAERAAETEHRVLDRQREFVRDASHELRTPITVARGHAELIKASVDGSGQTARDVDVILDELARLSKLSDRLLTLAGADHPGFLLFEDVPVEPLVIDTVRRWGPAVARDWLTVVDAPGSVTADRTRVEAALDALIDNAVNATAMGDRITLGAKAEGSALVLEVADGGRGIEAEDLPHVFERFSRREPDRGRRSGGTGLGLAIVKAIVDAHGGTVEVRSRPGMGTSFVMRLPRYVVAGGDAEEAVTPTPIRSAT